MAKYYGKIGYAKTVEVTPGVWEEKIVEREYYGDVIRMNRRLQTVSDKVLDDITISNQFSIVSDPYACENIFAMRYIEFMGTKWKISDVEVQYPRLLLSVGGLYHGE